MKIDNTSLYVSSIQNAEDNDTSAGSEENPVFLQLSPKNRPQVFSSNRVNQQPFQQLTNGSRSPSIASRNGRDADSAPSSSTQGVEPGSIDSAPSPLDQIDETTVPIGDAPTFTIFGTNRASPPHSDYSLQQRTQLADAYTGRVKTQVADIESGSEAERNVKYLNAQPFMTPMGYFSGGLMAAGYDPHEKMTVEFNFYVGMGHPENLDRKEVRSYEAWEIAAGRLEHDRPEQGGWANFQEMHISSQAEEAKVRDLESIGRKLQDHWEEEVSKPMRDPSGTLAKRSGKADAYSIRATLQSLQADKAAFRQLSAKGQQAINRTLGEAGQVIIPNVYGYPMVGYAFIPYQPYDGDWRNHRPNQGVMIALNQGTVSEIHGDKDFADWAQKNHDSLLRSFPDKDMQGGTDAHWHPAGQVLDDLIAGDDNSHYKGLSLHSFLDTDIPARKLFNYTRTRSASPNYQLKYGNLTDGAGDNIASQYQALNARKADAADQTEVFGSSQQNWKAARQTWGNLLGYLPGIGNVIGIVFGTHDSIYGMTAEDRRGGTAAAVISGLQLAHELSPGAAKLKVGKLPSVLNYSSVHDSGWKYNPKTSEFRFTQTGRVKSQPWFQPSQKRNDGQIGPKKPPKSPHIGTDSGAGSGSESSGIRQSGASGVPQAEGMGARRDAIARADPLSMEQKNHGLSGVPNTDQTFGENADTIPDKKVISPSAASLYERDLQIKKEHNFQSIPDPKSIDYPARLNQLAAKVKDETGVVNSDLITLQKISYQYNTIIGIRPVDKFSTGLIESGYETKGFHIKGKSASWGPQAGLICADQRFSKLEGSEPARINKFNAAIDKSIQDHYAVKVPMELTSSRLEMLEKWGIISEISKQGSNGVRTFTAAAPSGKQYQFGAIPKKNSREELFSITNENKPIEVLAPISPGAKPFTADYDLLVVCPHLGDLGPQDNLPVPDVSHTVFVQRIDRYRKTNGINPGLQNAYSDPATFYQNEDREIGNASQRIRNLIPVINKEIASNNEEIVPNPDARRKNVVHHNADSGSPATEPAANFPATFVLPFKMGRFDEITIIHNAIELRDMVQQAKDHGYHVPLNPLWEEVKNVRRTVFADREQ